MSIFLDALIFGSGWLHVFLAPYTKVEESFNLHATHDVLMYGISPSNLYNYDHFTFPGAVPRTFIGSLLLAWTTAPFMYIATSLGLITSKFDIQIIVRLVLASMNAFGLSIVHHAVNSRFGRPTGFFFALLSVSQFHVPFWMGRTIPNMFAFFIVNLSTYWILNRQPNTKKPSVVNVRRAIVALTLAAVIFRAEVLLLLAPLVLQSIWYHYVGLRSVIRTGILAGTISLALTIPIDSYFWAKYPLWPEFSGIYFNVFEGKSSDWGISPFHVYLTAHLPKILLSSFPLSIFGALLDRRIRQLLFPHAVFILLISFLGHKEWRFIVYVVPVFNIAAARAVRWMVARPKGRFFGRFMFMLSLLLIIGNFVATIAFTLLSTTNYPGGVALYDFNQIYSNATTPNHVHICNLAAQTGASLFLHEHTAPSFLQHRTDWVYNKTENMTPAGLTRNTAITHLITEAPPTNDVWDVVEVVTTLAWKLDKSVFDVKQFYRVWDWLRITDEERLWIVKRSP